MKGMTKLIRNAKRGIVNFFVEAKKSLSKYMQSVLRLLELCSKKHPPNEPKKKKNYQCQENEPKQNIRQSKPHETRHKKVKSVGVCWGVPKCMQDFFHFFNES